MEQMADLIGIENMGDAMVIIILVAIAFIYMFYCEVYFRENQLVTDNQTKTIIMKRGMGFDGLLFIILLLLKVGVIETTVVGWSWWWITAPLWGPFAISIGILSIIGAGVGLIFLCIFLINYFKNWR